MLSAAKPKKRGKGFALPITEAELEQRLASGQAIRAIARDIGVNRQTLHQRAQPIMAKLRVEPCSCGRRRFHPGDCLERMRARTPEGVLARREAIVAMILTGATYAEIGETHGTTARSVRNGYYRHLTVEQRTERAALQAKRRRKLAPALGPAITPSTNELYRSMSAAVPRTLPRDLRDDVISDMVVAVLEGDDIATVVANARKFVNAGYSQWASRFGPRSLDEARFDDSDTTLLDTIPDPSALAAFDQFDNLQLWRPADADAR